MIQPFGKYVYVKPIEKSTALPLDTGTLCEYGEIIEVGPEVKLLKKGQTIGFLAWGVKHLELDDVRHYFVPEDGDFILCTIE